MENIPNAIQSDINLFHRSPKTGENGQQNFFIKMINENDENDSRSLSEYDDFDDSNYVQNTTEINQDNLLPSTNENSLEKTTKDNLLPLPKTSEKYCQTNAWKFISNKFKLKIKNGEKFESFGCLTDIKNILESNKFPSFLNEITSFLSEELSKPKENMFSELKNRGYLDSKIKTILNFFNEQIALNNKNSDNKINPLDTSFLESQEENIREKKPHNPNDALKAFSTFIRKKVKKEKPGFTFPDFKFYNDITLNILKKKEFPKYLSYFVSVVNEEIWKYKNQKEKYNGGLFAILRKRGYDQTIINRILQTWNQLVVINNHIPKCQKCTKFFGLNFTECKEIECNELDFIKRPEKNHKTEYSEWCREISQKRCQGFDPADSSSFEKNHKKRGKIGNKKGKRNV